MAPCEYSVRSLYVFIVLVSKKHGAKLFGLKCRPGFSIRRRMEKPGRHFKPNSFAPCFFETRTMKTYSDRTEYSHGAIQWNNSGYLPAPGLQPNHEDGPLLYFSDGQLHWLNLWERLKLALGLTDAELLQWKRRPNLSKAFGVKKPF